MTEKFMTMAEFSRHVGVTKVTVLTWRRKGFLALAPDGRVDVAKSIARLKTRPTKFRGGSTKGPCNGAAAEQAPTTEQMAAAPGWSLAESTRRRQAAMARLAELDVQQREGKLIEVETAHNSWAGIMLAARGMVLGLAGQICFEIPTLTPTDKETIQRICRDALEDTSMGRGCTAIGRAEGENGVPDATPGPDTPIAEKDDSLSFWTRRKEKALAEKHELELAIKRGQFCEVEETCRQLEQEFSTIRERLLSIAGKLADVLAHRNRDEVFTTLAAEIHSILTELSAPAAIAVRVVEQQQGGGQ